MVDQSCCTGILSLPSFACIVHFSGYERVCRAQYDVFTLISRSLLGLDWIKYDYDEMLLVLLLVASLGLRCTQLKLASVLETESNQ